MIDNRRVPVSQTGLKPPALTMYVVPFENTLTFFTHLLFFTELVLENMCGLDMLCQAPERVAMYAKYKMIFDDAFLIRSPSRFTSAICSRPNTIDQFMATGIETG